jgi:hypothetical protein
MRLTREIVTVPLGTVTPPLGSVARPWDLLPRPWTVTPPLGPVTPPLGSVTPSLATVTRPWEESAALGNSRQSLGGFQSVFNLLRCFLQAGGVRRMVKNCTCVTARNGTENREMPEIFPTRRLVPSQQIGL